MRLLKIGIILKEFNRIALIFVPFFRLYLIRNNENEKKKLSWKSFVVNFKQIIDKIVHIFNCSLVVLTFGP